MELYRTRTVFGYAEIGWYLRQWARSIRARSWAPVEAIVEGYELLAADGNGWLATFYSYHFQGEPYSGEFRRWILFGPLNFKMGDKVGSIMDRLPRGSGITVRVNPRKPTESAYMREPWGAVR